MDREAIRDEARRLYEDTSTTASKQRWSNTVLNTRINEIHKAICVRTKCIRSRITVDTITAGTAEYAMPSIFINAIAAYILDSASDWLPLVKKTEKELDMYDRNWRDTSGDPASHFYRRREYVGLYPNPSVTRASALRVDFYRLPDDFSADTDVPYESVTEYFPFHRLIAVKAARQSLPKGDTEGKLLLTREFEKGIREMIQVNQLRGEETRMTNIYEQARTSPRRTR